MSFEEASKLAARYKMNYFEVSAKDDLKSVETVFQSIAKSVAETHKLEVSNNSKSRKTSLTGRPSGEVSSASTSKCC